MAREGRVSIESSTIRGQRERERKEREGERERDRERETERDRERDRERERGVREIEREGRLRQKHNEVR